MTIVASYEEDVVWSASSPNLQPPPPLPVTSNVESAVVAVGQSVFYDCIDLSPMAEKQNPMKAADCGSDTEESESNE